MPKKSLLETPILIALKHNGETSKWDLAKFLCVSPQLMAHTLERLESEGKVVSHLEPSKRIVFIDSTGQQAYSKTRIKRIYQLKSLEIKDKEA
jgi:Mn-dependent DtxR family transcriptional regulator